MIKQEWGGGRKSYRQGEVLTFLNPSGWDFAGVFRLCRLACHQEATRWRCEQRHSQVRQIILESVLVPRALYWAWGVSLALIREWPQFNKVQPCLDLAPASWPGTWGICVVLASDDCFPWQSGFGIFLIFCPARFSLSKWDISVRQDKDCVTVTSCSCSWQWKASWISSKVCSPAPVLT